MDGADAGHAITSIFNWSSQVRGDLVEAENGHGHETILDDCEDDNPSNGDRLRWATAATTALLTALTTPGDRRATADAAGRVLRRLDDVRGGLLDRERILRQPGAGVAARQRQVDELRQRAGARWRDGPRRASACSRARRRRPGGADAAKPATRAHRRAARVRGARRWARRPRAPTTNTAAGASRPARRCRCRTPPTRSAAPAPTPGAAPSWAASPSSTPGTTPTAR